MISPRVCVVLFVFCFCFHSLFVFFSPFLSLFPQLQNEAIAAILANRSKIAGSDSESDSDSDSDFSDDDY